MRTSEPRFPPRQSARAFVAPWSIPYTTAASEFLYGYSVVLAAIKANHRKLYNLYIHPRAERNEGYAVLERVAKNARINLKHVDDSWLPLMDKMSSGRPHNGCIVETSPLPRPPIASLGAASMESNSFQVTLSHQSREDADINGSKEHYTYPSSSWRHPFILYADGVTDEGNLGGIIRSAYFLGVDAIALPTRTSAPITHIALKASAGAAEAIPIFAVADPTGFLRDSSDAGWCIYASDAPTPIPSAPGGFGTQLDATPAAERKAAPRHPTILMLGSEGSGIKSSLMAKAHFKVGIRGARVSDEVGVDSLNVSTAAAMLCGEFMRRPVVEKGGKEGFLF
ncbi:alpha/beta knot [Mytilinidion resinicola]|uniref:rRNA methyltransferase 1, mitochondrial n=1 Tax=Mytilinidion resinicola TaxID=574789 RepID=A0A6A6YXR2_9PEZI|nr:alpha/beta knot [Mytilinidion resinicola]KAF2812705.1 alpha/beta knot [Mytilinidion resinicola]